MPPRRSVPAPSLEAGGGGAELSWVLGQWSPRYGGPALADLSSHLPPSSCRAGAAEGMSARVS